jgi:hypothetical protein
MLQNRHLKFPVVGMGRHLTLFPFTKKSHLVVFVGLLLSCEEIIQVNLISTEPKVVIESYITNGEKPVWVKVSKSQNYFNQDSILPVKHAFVQLDYLDISEILREKMVGVYFSSGPVGVAGKSYVLKVKANGKTYGATVDLPPPVNIDTVYFKPGLFRTDSLNVFIEFHDPPKTENYYRLKLYRNKWVAINDFYMITDSFSEGQKIVLPVYYRYFAPNDTVVVELLNLERNTWRYIKGMSENLQQGLNSQAPGNPPTNLSGGALGIFGAYGSSSYCIIATGVVIKK